MARKIRNHIALTIFVSAAVIICCLTQDSSQLPGQRRSRNESCGTQNDVADRIEICAKPVMSIIEGTLDKWPRTLGDTEDLCQQIHQAERCIRDESRQCAQGLHKTIISTVANSIQRVRKRECAKDKQPAILRMVNCIEKHTKDTKQLIASVVGKMNIVENQITDLDKKTNSICCIIKTLETDIKILFDRICPADTQTILRLYRGVLDDLLELICRSAKCQGDMLRGYKSSPVTYETGKFIAMVLRIIFSLDG